MCKYSVHTLYHILIYDLMLFSLICYKLFYKQLNTDTVTCFIQDDLLHHWVHLISNKIINMMSGLILMLEKTNET